MAASVWLMLLMGFACWLSLTLTRTQGGVASIWIANGLLVAALLLAPRSQWFALGLGTFSVCAVVRLAVGDDWPLALGLTAINGLESWAIAATIRRAVPDLRDVGKLRRLAMVATASTLLACASSATLATGLIGLLADVAGWHVWWTWLSAHILGMVTVATISLTVQQLGKRVFGHAGRRLDLLGCVGVLLATFVGVLAQQQLPVLFLVYLPLTLLTYRHGFAGLVAGTLILAAAGSFAAAFSWGPFAMVGDHSVEARALLLQLLVAASCLLTFPIAVAMADRRFLSRALAESRAHLQAVADNVPVHIAHMDANERYTFANATLGRAVGMEPAAMIGKAVRDVRSEAVYSQLQPSIARALAGQAQALEYHVTAEEGRTDYHCQFKPDLGPDGTVRGVYSIAMDISVLKQAERELESLARTDALSGLANRRQFQETLAAAVERAQRNGQALVLLMLDVDNFKAINDTYGHAVGDLVIQEVARRLRDCVYAVDLPARLGGDEFVILIEYSADADVGSSVALRITNALHEPMLLLPAALQVTASIGIGVHFPVRSAETLFGLADDALYDAKAAGRDRWCLREG